MDFWCRFLLEIKQRDKKTRAMLSDARLGQVTGNLLEIVVLQVSHGTPTI